MKITTSTLFSVLIEYSDDRSPVAQLQLRRRLAQLLVLCGRAALHEPHHQPLLLRMHLHSHAKASSCNRQVREGNGERKEGGGSHAVTSYYGFSLLVAEYLEQALAIDDQSQMFRANPAQHNGLQRRTQELARTVEMERRRRTQETLLIGSLSLLAEKSLRPCTIRLRFLLLFS